MSGRAVTLTGYLVIILAGVALQLASRREGSRIPSISTVFSRAMRTRSGRVGIMTGWFWLGLHFFAR